MQAAWQRSRHQRTSADSRHRHGHTSGESLAYARDTFPGSSQSACSRGLNPPASTSDRAMSSVTLRNPRAEPRCSRRRLITSAGSGGVGSVEVGDHVGGAAFQGASQPAEPDPSDRHLGRGRVNDSFRDHLTGSVEPTAGGDHLLVDAQGTSTSTCRRRRTGRSAGHVACRLDVPTEVEHVSV